MHRIKERYHTIISPETGKPVELALPIYRTIRETRPEMGIVTHDGVELDFSNLEEVEGIPSIPADVEVVLMLCSDQWPKVPVRLDYPDIGNYRGIWIRREDLVRVKNTTIS